jgi:hypothetical protein
MREFGKPSRRANMELRKVEIEFSTPVEKCPICGHEEIREFALASCQNGNLPPVPHMEEPIHYWQCKSCFHVFQNPTYSTLFERGMYASGFYREATYPQGPTLHEFRREQYRAMTLANAIYTFVDMKLFYATKHLDVGAGMGALSVELVMMFGGKVKSYPCEVDPESLKLYELSKLPTFKSLEEAKSEAPYDFVTASHFFEHMVEPIPVLKEINSLMAPSATLLMVVPNMFDPRPGTKYGVWHPHVFTEESIKKFAKVGGFEVYKLGFIGPKEESPHVWALLRKE